MSRDPLKYPHRNLWTALLLLSAGLFLLNAWRAATLSFTHDESFGFLHYIDDSFMEILSYNAKPLLPNNHILNTLGMNFCYALFGDAEWSLRLPVVLSYGLYLWFALLLVRRIRPWGWMLLAFALLNLHPYLLDFFALARGYAMSCALMLGSIHYYLRYLENEEQRAVTWAFGLGALSVLANFTQLNVFLGLLLLHQIVGWGSGKMTSVRGLLRHNLRSGLIFAGMAAICYEPIRKLIKFGMAYGGDQGFWADTANSLIDDTVYQSPMRGFLKVFVTVLVIGLFGGMVLSALRRGWIEGKKIVSNAGFALTVLLLLAVVSTMLQFYLFGSPFLFHRTALLFIPLFAVATVFLLPDLLKLLPQRIQNATGLGLALLVAGHFLLVRQHAQVLEWPLDAHNKAVLTRVADAPRAPDQKVRIGISWYFEPGLNFYRRQQDYQWLDSLTRDGFEGAFDYYYLHDADQAFLSRSGKRVLWQSPDGRTTLGR